MISAGATDRVIGAASVTAVASAIGAARAIGVGRGVGAWATGEGREEAWAIVAGPASPIAADPGPVVATMRFRVSVEGLLRSAISIAAAPATSQWRTAGEQARVPAAGHVRVRVPVAGHVRVRVPVAGHGQARAAAVRGPAAAARAPEEAVVAAGAKGDRP